MTMALIDHLLTRGRALVLEQFSPKSCIVSTRVAIEVLKAHGIPAYPLATRIEALNAQAVKDSEAGATEPSLGSWIVGVEGTGEWSPTENSWDGHLVAVFTDAKSEVLLDLSADQIARPAKGIHAEPLAFRLTGKWPAGWLWPNGSAIAYKPVRSRSYRQSSNWTDRRAWGPIVEALLEEYPPTRVDPVTPEQYARR